MLTVLLSSAVLACLSYLHMPPPALYDLLLYMPRNAAACFHSEMHFSSDDRMHASHVSHELRSYSAAENFKPLQFLELLQAAWVLCHTCKRNACISAGSCLLCLHHICRQPGKSSMTDLMCSTDNETSTVLDCCERIQSFGVLPLARHRSDGAVLTKQSRHCSSLVEAADILKLLCCLTKEKGCTPLGHICAAALPHQSQHAVHSAPLQQLAGQHDPGLNDASKQTAESVLQWPCKTVNGCQAVRPLCCAAGADETRKALQSDA